MPYPVQNYPLKINMFQQGHHLQDAVLCPEPLGADNGEGGQLSRCLNCGGWSNLEILRDM
jgi:hypothetical protein